MDANSDSTEVFVWFAKRETKVFEQGKPLLWANHCVPLSLSVAPLIFVLEVCEEVNELKEICKCCQNQDFNNHCEMIYNRSLDYYC